MRFAQLYYYLLKAMGTTSANLTRNLNTFLQHFRKTPHAETKDSPAKLFLGRNIRTRLDLVRPQAVHSSVSERQKAQLRPAFRTLPPGQSVYVLSGYLRRDYRKESSNI